MKTYSIRVPDSVAGVTSSAMQARLRQFFIDGAAAGIPDDPGAGPTVIRRTLPENLVAKFSAALGVSTSEALRRLALCCVRALPSGAARPPGLSSRSSYTICEPSLWWAPFAEPGANFQSEPAVPPASKAAAISPWRAFWGEVWPELLMVGIVLLTGWFTGGLSVGSGSASAEPYSDWKPE